MGVFRHASRDGTLLHAQAGRNPPLGSAVTGTPSVPIACRGAATALSGVASVDGATSHTQAPPPGIAKKHAKSVGSHRHRAPDFHVFSGPIYASGPPYSNGALHVNSPHTSTRLSPCAGAVLPYVSTAGSCYNFIVAASGSA